MPLLNSLIDLLIVWPRRIAACFDGCGPLLARLVTGYTFAVTGWAKLHNLTDVTAYFTDLGIPYPQILTPFVAGWEFLGGVLLILGLLTRIAGGGLAVVMVVATISAKLADTHSLADLLGYEEATYFAVFTWLALAGAGRYSLDHLLEQKRKGETA